MGTKKTLRGTVAVTDWDEEGGIAGISIVDDHGNEYFVDPFSPAHQVVEELDRRVEATGIVYCDDGLYTMTVRSYRVLDSPLEDPAPLRSPRPA